MLPCCKKTILHHEHCSQFFQHCKFLKLKILWKRAGLQASKVVKDGGSIQISNLQNNEESVLLWTLGTGNSVQIFERKFVVPRYLSIWNKCSLYRNEIIEINVPCKPMPVSDGFNFPCESKSSKIIHRKAGVSWSPETRIF